MKKLFSLLLVCVLLAGVLTACKDNSTILVPSSDNDLPQNDGAVDVDTVISNNDELEASTGVVVSVDGEIDLNLDNSGNNLPYNINVNFGEDSQTTMMFSWHTADYDDTQVLQITPAYNVGFNSYTEYAPIITQWPDNDKDGNLAYGERSICRAVVADLSPDTEYMYRVGSPDGGWSASRYFKTSGSDSFTFTVISDPQSSLDSTAYTEAVNAVAAAGNNDFLMICGDISELVGCEQHYLNFFEKFSDINTMPYVTIPGNHETLNYTDTSSSSYSEISGEAEAYNAHFYNPQNGPVFSKAFNGTVNTSAPGENAVNSSYYFYYNRTLFIMVNTQQDNNNLLKTVDWIESVLKLDRANGLSDMTVVAMHKGIYGNRYYGITYSLHELFYEVFEKYDVDLVLSGHDHSYSRTAPKDDALTSDDETVGTIYSIVGSPGPKLYQPQVDSEWQWDFMLDISGTTTGELAVGVYSVMTIDDLGLHSKTYNLNGKLVDSYFIPKKRSNGVSYTSEDKPVISVTALSDRAILTVSGNLNNVSEFSIEASGEVLATVGRGESGCTVYDLTPNSSKTVYLRTVYTDGTGSVEKMSITTTGFISYSDGKLSLNDEGRMLCDEYIVYVNGESVGRLLKNASCSLDCNSNDIVTVELVKDSVTVCCDYIMA